MAMKVSAFALIPALLVLGPMSHSEVTFSSYVKKNHKILKETGKSPETVAFQEKKMYRNLASTPPSPMEQEKKMESPEANANSLPDSPEQDTTDNSTPRPNQ